MEPVYVSPEESRFQSFLPEGARPGTPERARALGALLDIWFAEDSEGSWQVIQDFIARKKAPAEAKFG